MTEKQTQHINSLISTFSELAYDKYERGTEEHSGHLYDVNPQKVLDYAIEEAIDQVVYLLTLKEQLYGTRKQP